MVEQNHQALVDNVTGDPIVGLLSAANVEDARLASKSLLQTSKAALLAKDPRLEQAFARWWARAAEPTEPDRLKIVALLWRLTSLSAMSGHRRRLGSEIQREFRPDLAKLATLTDPKDRRAVAEALLLTPQAAWLAVYAADAVVSDPDPKSEARDTMCAVLLRQTGDVGRAFVLLSERFETLTFKQQDPSTGRARRLAWILRSFRPPLHNDEVALARTGFGQQFETLVMRGLGDGRTSDRAAFIDGAREVLLTLNAVVRLNGLTLAADAGTYTSVEMLRRRFEATEWPEPLKAPVERLSVRVAEALLTLARQGIADAGLRRVFVALLGAHAAGSRLRQSVQLNEGVTPEIAYWLETGQQRDRLETASAIEETATSMIDLELARALLEAFRADDAISRGTSPEEPLRRMAREMREAARKRSIVLRGEPGEVVDLSPLEHDVDQSVMGLRRVKLVTPLVERVAGGRSLGVLIKAHVVPEESS